MVLCVYGLIISVNAQTATSTQQGETTASVQTKDDVQNDALAPVETSTEQQTAVPQAKEMTKEQSQQNGKGWPSFKDKPWYYIGAGAFILVVVVLYVVTGGQGLNSRS